MNNNIGKISSIQFLRAFAVLLVVYCHVIDMQKVQKEIRLSFQHNFFYLENFGAVGVDIFFVISGLIILIVSRGYAQSGDAFKFLVKRATRIAPLYWLVSFLFIVHNFIFYHKTPSINAIINTLIFSPGNPVMAIGWTLSFELLFYITIALAMLINKSKYIYIAISLFILLMLINYGLFNNNSLLQFFGNAIFLEFFLGIFIGLFFISAKSVKPIVSTFLLIAGILGLCISIFLNYGNISEFGNILDNSLSFDRFVIWGIPSALLVAGAVLKEKSKPFNIPAFFILIGDASFSIYLTHVMIGRTMYMVWSKIAISAFVHPDLILLLTLMLTIIGGCIFYKLIELPLLSILNSKVRVWSKIPKVKSIIN